MELDFFAVGTLLVGVWIGIIITVIALLIAYSMTEDK